MDDSRHETLPRPGQARQHRQGQPVAQVLRQPQLIGGQGHRLAQEADVDQRLADVPNRLLGRDAQLLRGSPLYSARGMTRKKYVAWAPAVTSSSATKLPGIAIRNQILFVSLPGSTGDIATHRGASAPAVAHSDS